MKVHSMLLTAGLVSLAGCATQPHAPVESLVDSAPVIQREVVSFEQSASEAVVAEPTFADLSPSAWTVQVAALKNLEEMAAVESENRLDDVFRVPTVDSNLGELHTVLVGVYDNRDDAEQVAKQLPEKVAGDDPWIRSVASVQAVMR